MVQPLTGDDPRRLGSFELTGRLGEGGQGVVYLGRGPAGEQVAVKLLHHGLTSDPEARTRFLLEVSVAQRVARFCTAPVLHADLAGSQPYIVSEYVPGPSLRQLVDGEGPRRGGALERLAISTATALSAIHRAGILHRDFKPANVLMGPEGPVVIDFGIARALDSPGITATGTAMGTPSYLSPEQLNPGEVTPAADVFAWGVTMVFAATGTPAFGQDSIAVVMNRILNVEPDLSGLEGMLRDLVAACLSKDPALRPTAEELVSHLTGSAPTNRVRLPALAPIPVPMAATPQPGNRRQGNNPQGNNPQGIPPQGGPQQGLPPQGGPQQAKQKVQRPVGLLLAAVAGVAALAVATGAAVVLQNNGKASTIRAAAAATPSAQETTESEPAPVPDEPPTTWESPKPPKKTQKTEEPPPVVRFTPPPPRQTAQPSPRPTKKTDEAAGGGSSEQDGDVPKTPSATPPTVEPISKPTATAKPTVKPTTAPPKPTPKPTTAPPKPNPYTATGVCGSGYKVINSRALGNAATIYLLFSSAAGKNCVVTMSRHVVPSKISMNAVLQAKSGASGSNPGRFTAYAGPVRISAAKTCVIWGGSHGSLSWKSGWSHCG